MGHFFLVTSVVKSVPIDLNKPGWPFTIVSFELVSVTFYWGTQKQMFWIMQPLYVVTNM